MRPPANVTSISAWNVPAVSVSAAAHAYWTIPFEASTTVGTPVTFAAVAPGSRMRNRCDVPARLTAEPSGFFSVARRTGSRSFRLRAISGIGDHDRVRRAGHRHDESTYARRGGERTRPVRYRSGGRCEADVVRRRAACPVDLAEPADRAPVGHQFVSQVFDVSMMNRPWPLAVGRTTRNVFPARAPVPENVSWSLTPAPTGWRNCQKPRIRPRMTICVPWSSWTHTWAR